MKIKQLDMAESAQCYVNALASVERLHGCEVPDVFVELAAECSKRIVAAICKKNGLELEE